MDAVKGVPYEESEEYKKENNDYGQMGKYRNYEIKEAAQNIIDAEKCKNDPEKMKYVKKCLEKDYMAAKDAVESLDDLRKVYDKKMQEQGGY